MHERARRSRRMVEDGGRTAEESLYDSGAIARIGAGGAGTLGLSGAPHLTTSTPRGSKV